MKRAENQPTSELVLYAGIYCKLWSVPDRGTLLPQHSHVWDHISLIVQGAVRVWRDEDLIGDFKAPAMVKIEAYALHKFLTGDGERRVQAVDAVLRQAQDDRGLRQAQPAGRRSITLVRVARALPGYSLLDVTIKTGRTHQIRVHLTHEGHAIVGDDKYGDFALNKAFARGDAAPGCRFDRMFLHARRLRFTHPASGEVLELEAPLPAECEALIRALAARA